MEKLQEVKVGDKLLVRTRYGEGIEVVERITPTLAVTKTNRFKKSDGYELNAGTWNSTYARLATEEDVERIREANKRNLLAAKCNGIRFEQLTVAQLEEILKIAEGK